MKLRGANHIYEFFSHVQSAINVGAALKVNPMANFRPKMTSDGGEGINGDPSGPKRKESGRKEVSAKVKQLNKKSTGVEKPQKAQRELRSRVIAPPPAPDADDELEDDSGSSSDSEGVSMYSE